MGQRAIFKHRSLWFHGARVTEENVKGDKEDLVVRADTRVCWDMVRFQLWNGLQDWVVHALANSVGTGWFIG